MSMNLWTVTRKELENQQARKLCTMQTR